MDLPAAIAWLKQQRRVKSMPVPNYPARKWLAGYFDGDGCLHAYASGKNKWATMKANIACADYDTAGIETLAKNFGGTIHSLCGGRAAQWNLCLSPSKANHFLSYFAKHLVTKRDQAYFVLGCAKMGHYHDGERIEAILKQLKQTHLHRLNEPKLAVDELLSQVKNIPAPWNREGQVACSVCHTSDHKHAANGICDPCYQRLQRTKLQSEAAA
jgi:hypothetical protein